MKKLTHSEILIERLSIDITDKNVCTTISGEKIERHPVSLMIVNVRSLYNVGSIFRTADAGLVKELILCGFTPHPPRKEIEKTALGAVDTVPWSYYSNAINAINDQKSKGIKVVAVEITDKKRPYTSLKFDEFPLCLVLGNELTGLDKDIIDNCDDAIEIPMFGVKHSLNVSVATGIVVYEAIRLWKIFSK